MPSIPADIKTSFSRLVPSASRSLSEWGFYLFEMAMEIETTQIQIQIQIQIEFELILRLGRRPYANYWLLQAFQTCHQSNVHWEKQMMPFKGLQIHIDIVCTIPINWLIDCLIDWLIDGWRKYVIGNAKLNFWCVTLRAQWLRFRENNFNDLICNCIFNFLSIL